MDVISPDTIRRLETQSVALYGMRLAQIGPKTFDADDDMKVREWAASCLSEAMNVLSLQFGVESAAAMMHSMLDAVNSEV